MKLNMFKNTERKPRQEYPRPDFQRGTSEGIDWINLNGTWEFDFDPDDTGEQEKWFATDSTHLLPLQIQVPYPWESLAAWGQEKTADNANYLSRNAYLNPEAVTCGGLARDGNYREAPRHTIGWYRKTVSIPDTWKDKRVILKFGAADWHAKVWVNGEYVGEHQNGYLPFEFDITDKLKSAKLQNITVRVYDAQEHGEQTVGKQANWYTRTSGLWQTVYLEPRNETYIQQAHITPDIDAKAAGFKVNVAGRCDNITLRWNCDGIRGQLDAAHTTEFTVEIPSEKLRLWEPDAPHLYNVTLQLISEDATVDRVHTYFGMRKLSIEKAPRGDYQYIYLNNRPIYLLGALNQSFNPEGVYTFLTDEAIRTDIERAKEFGFNFLRLHIKVDEPRLYYWADKLGMLFMCDIPNFSNYTETAKARLEETLRGNIARDYNHPSIISWCVFNETWGLGGREYKQLTERQEWVRQMYNLTKSLDETRLIEDNSPCLYDHVETDINSWHFYINDYQQAKEHIANVVEQTYPGSPFNYTGENVQSDAPLINSEYGGISAGAGDKDVAWCFKYLTNELRRHPKICGYVYTELQDIEWEHNGFMNYDRSVKEFGYDYTDINTLDFIAIDYPPGTTVTAGDNVSMDIYASHFSNKAIDSATLQWRLDVLDATGVLSRSVLSGTLPQIPFPQYHVEKVHRLELAMPDVQSGVGTLHVWVTDEQGNVVARNFVNFEFFNENRNPIGTFDYNPGDVSESHWESESTAQLFCAQGAGYTEYVIPISNVSEIKRSTRLSLVFEASSSNGAARQTEPEKYPSDVTISINGIEIETVTLPDCPADARGVLSYINGQPGIYGYLTQITVDGTKLKQLQSTLTDTLTVRYEVKPDAKNKGGFALYGSRIGRFPTNPHLIFAP